jgi:hypothetical protein
MIIVKNGDDESKNIPSIPLTGASLRLVQGNDKQSLKLGPLKRNN